MRGILFAIPPHCKVKWISPAHAGNTWCQRPRSPGSADQPRTCGEYLQVDPALAGMLGSAPHMRGIQGVPVWAGVDGGISPAHAGNTRRPGGERRRQPDQPRTCGEYGVSGRACSRLRDQPRTCGEYGVSGRACSRLRDQPRTCGEYHSPARAGLTGMGSAPHMRGIHGEVARGLSHVRISPAHAGNTIPIRSWTCWPPDQPRTCGEYSSSRHLLSRQPGSAPHMRGIRVRFT